MKLQTHALNIEEYGIKEGHFGHNRMELGMNEGCWEKRKRHSLFGELS